MSENLKKLYELKAEIEVAVKNNADDAEINRLGELHERLFEKLTREEKEEYTGLPRKAGNL